MRIALVSPYSWTYPGGVTRHIESLAEQQLALGHDVRVLSPYDPCDRLAARMHRGAWPQSRPLPDYVVPLGRTVGLPANGAVSNLALTTFAVQTLRTELRTGFDVVHVHEPVAPMPGWDAVASARAPLVGTFHAYSTNPLANHAASLLGARRLLNRLHVRIAVSEAAAWTNRRFFGGDYLIVPNGVDAPDVVTAHRAQPPTEARPLRLVFVGASVARKGLPVLLRAYEALREHVPVTLAIIGADQAEIEPLMLESTGVTALGKVSDAEKWRRLHEADLLVAPSLGGESFGMVLTEAYAAGTPVVASDIAGYRDVVRDGIDGLLVPRGDATALAEALRELAFDTARRTTMSHAAAVHAGRYAWPRIAAEVLDAYQDAIAMPAAARPAGRAAATLGLAAADGRPRPAPRRLPSLEPELRTPRQRLVGRVGRAAVLLAVLLGAGLAFLALNQIGLPRIAASLLTSRPNWVVVGLGLMCLSMLLRGFAWHAILQAALPRRRVRRRDAMQGTFIGVLMSATLPARLGEPSRSLIVARRVGRPRETLPIVLGTIVSQTLLNLIALVGLGIVMFSSVDIFNGRHGALLLAAVAPAAILLAILLAPLLLDRGAPARSARLRQLRGALARVRDGLRVFRDPRRAATAAAAQLTAWVLQWLSCYTLLIALGLDHRAGLAAAAAVLFAVNVTAVVPAAPSNLGVFQAACVAVLTGAYHVSTADALAYGIILQAVEVATAVLMGMPALVGEGLSWREVRLRAMHSAPVKLAARVPSAAADR